MPGAREAEPGLGGGRASAGCCLQTARSHFLPTTAQASAGSEEAAGVMKHWSPWRFSQPLCEVGATIPAFAENEK